MKKPNITIRGKIKEILFKREKYNRRYIVLMFSLENDVVVKCNGFIPHVKENDKVIIKGHFYDRIFYASKVEIFNPQKLLNKSIERR